jgi:hypothetical protein
MAYSPAEKVASLLVKKAKCLHNTAPGVEIIRLGVSLMLLQSELVFVLRVSLVFDGKACPSGLSDQL